MRELNKDEQRERKLMGGMYIMWAIIGSVIVDQIILSPKLLVSGWTDSGILSLFPFLFTLIIPPVVAGWVVKVYWK